MKICCATSIYSRYRAEIKEKYIDILEKSDKILSTFWVQGFCLILYKVLVDLIYFLYIGPTFDYGIRVNVLNTISSYLYLGIYAIFQFDFAKGRTTSSIMFIYMNMIYFIPITTYCSLGSGSSGLLFFAVLYWTLFSILQVITPVITLKKLEMSKQLYSFFMYLLLIGISVFTIYLAWKYTGFRILMNFRGVYDIRAEAAAYDMPTAFKYLQSFSAILIAILLLFSFLEKKYVLVLWEVFLLIINFSFAGHKSVVFMGILVLAGVIFWRKQMVSLILPGGIVLAILAMVEETVFRHSYIISLFFRRMGYLLAQLSDEYYRYFRSNPTEIFRGTFLGKLGFETPYSLPVSYVIGNNYLSQINDSNNGILADVWSNLGVIGILIMPFILMACFRLFDLVTDGIPPRYVVGLALYFGGMFCNGTWTTILLTHGFLIMCIAYFVFPRDTEISGEKK